MSPTNVLLRAVLRLCFGCACAACLRQDTETGNTFRGIVLKWSEPENAREPDKRWRLYVFKVTVAVTVAVAVAVAVTVTVTVTVAVITVTVTVDVTSSF
jgi:hypothetical protein